MWKFQVERTLTDAQIIEADIHQISSCDTRGRLDWVSYCLGSYTSGKRLFSTPEQAFGEYEQAQKRLASVPKGQKCRRELEDKKIKPELCRDATRDYNGHGYWVCDHCDQMLNDEFDANYN